MIIFVLNSPDKSRYNSIPRHLAFFYPPIKPVIRISLGNIRFVASGFKISFVCLYNYQTIQTKPTTMITTDKINITVEATINAPVERVWSFWTLPEHITQWNNASDDWHTPSATNDLQVGGKFTCRMEAKDGSFGFDFWGIYDEVKTNELIAYTMGDGRKAKIIFTNVGNATKVVETFEAETENSVELQRGGWQAILNNFKKYTETNYQP
jgi:uncharacterized protein YndB with AHSA1/START domain